MVYVLFRDRIGRYVAVFMEIIGSGWVATISVTNFSFLLNEGVPRI